LEEYCWEHLPENLKGKYKAKIEKWVGEGRSLEEANLYRVEIPEAYIDGANLQKANLREAKLQNAKLHWARLQEADLIKANLENARLAGANFQEAKLNNTRFHNAFLCGIQLDGAKMLTWEQVKRVGEEIYKKWGKGRDAYRRLKNYFHQEGIYDDETQAYYREKLMAQREAWKNHKVGRWLWLFLLNILAGFGEKLWRTVVGAFATILIFSGIYWLAGKLVTNGGEPITKFWHCLYFSVVTFATLGFGDISPALHSTGTQVAAVIEVILGYVFLGTLITIIARKFGR